jgi:1-acyl-sn-glycerol-3-phosphate acyltransferase
LIAWVEKFKKRPLTLQEYDDVVVSHWFWIGVLGLNTIVHVLLVLDVGLKWWALYSFVGWYVLFGIAMVLQLLFAHRNSIRQWTRNGWGYGLFGGVIVLGFIPAIISYLFQRAIKNPKSHVVFQSITAAMFRLFFRYAPNISKVCVLKDNELQRDKHYIYTATHESWLDYPLVGAYVTDLYHLTNKSNAFHWSISGIGRLLGVVDGMGGNPLHNLLQKLRDNSNVLIFPEGSREVDGKLLPFKKGAFSLSLESGIPIVPVIISGTRNLVAKGSMNWLNISGVVITVRMLGPVHILENETIDGFKQRVWDVMNQNSHND